MSQDWNHQGPPPPPPPPPQMPLGNDYNPYGYGGAPPPGFGGSGAVFPWEDRARLGFVTALIESGKLLITQPKEAYSRLKPNGDLTSPLLFGLIIAWPVAIVSVVWQLLFSGMLGGLSSGEAAGAGLMQFAFIIICYPIIYAVSVFLLAGIFHLTLSLLKGLDQSPFGFEGSLKVVAYAMIANVAGIIPMIGGLITLGLLIYLAINGIEVVHRTSQKNAVITVLVPIALCCVCILASIALFGAALMAAFGNAG